MDPRTKDVMVFGERVAARQLELQQLLGTAASAGNFHDAAAIQANQKALKQLGAALSDADGGIQRAVAVKDFRSAGILLNHFKKVRHDLDAQLKVPATHVAKPATFVRQFLRDLDAVYLPYAEKFESAGFASKAQLCAARERDVQDLVPMLVCTPVPTPPPSAPCPPACPP